MRAGLRSATCPIWPAGDGQSATARPAVRRWYGPAERTQRKAVTFRRLTYILTLSLETGGQLSPERCL